MNDLISRAAAIELIERNFREWGDEYDVTDILKDLNDMPSAEQTKPKKESYEINVCPYCGIDLTED